MSRQPEKSDAWCEKWIEEEPEKSQYYQKISDDFFHKFLKEPLKYGPKDQFEESLFTEMNLTGILMITYSSPL